MGYVVAYEVLLDGEFLMSSVITASEIALAELGLAAWGDAPCRVLVGGLGLGYTAQAALRGANVQQVDVVELLDEVLEWHRTALVPLGAMLTAEPRVRLIQGDFFAWASGESDGTAAPRYDVVLLDIDHSSEFLLASSSESFYSVPRLRKFAERLDDRGVFAFWSSDYEEHAFAENLRAVFPSVEVHEVRFFSPAIDSDEINTVIVARKQRPEA